MKLERNGDSIILRPEEPEEVFDALSYTSTCRALECLWEHLTGESVHIGLMEDEESVVSPPTDHREVHGTDESLDSAEADNNVVEVFELVVTRDGVAKCLPEPHEETSAGVTVPFARGATDRESVPLQRAG